MALGPQPGVSQIFSAIRAPETRFESLHRLKHIIIGHDEQKSEFVRAGLVDTLVAILEEDASYRQTRNEHSLEAQTEVIIILNSLARSGSAFLTAGQIKQLIPLLLGLLDLHPPHGPLMEATLRALNSILSLPTVARSPELVSVIQSNRSILRSISYVLNNSTSSRDYASYQATILLPKTCTPGDNSWQDAIVESGILAALVNRAARLIKAVDNSRIRKGDGVLKIDRHAVERMSSLSKSSSNISLLPHRREPSRMFDRLPISEPIAIPPAPYIAALLDAIAFTIRDSKFKSDEFLFASYITDILGEEAPQDPPRHPPIWRDSKATDESQSAGSGGYHYAGQDFPPLSPTSERHQARGTTGGGPLNPTASYPPAENSLDHERRPKIPQITHLCYAGEKDSDPESPFIRWLISFIRHESDPLTRLNAIGLLTDLVHAGCVSKRNVKKVGRFIVPMLVRYLDEPDTKSDTSTVTIKKAYDLSFQAQESEWAVREKAPAILATLLTDNQHLQAAAVEAEAVKRLTGMLKRAFDAIPSTGDGEDMLWNEKVRAHQLKVREGSLRALAAIALFEDDHRKKIIESGALAYVVGSLIPESTVEESEGVDIDMGGTHDPNMSNSQSPEAPENDSTPSFTVPETSRTGNPVPVLVAATNVVRSLSRSVNVLSTSLIDWQVSEPLFKLLSHDSIQVQIAATAALCNLVMEFSPLRAGLEKMGIVKALGALVRKDEEYVCSYNKKTNTFGEFDSNREALRLNAIWALKHLVLKQDDKIIASCLSSFGTAWLLEQIGLEDRASPSHGNEDDENDHSEDGRRLLESHSIEFSHSVMLRLASNYEPLKPDEQRRKALTEFQEQALDFFRNIMAGSYATGTFRKILEDTKGVIVTPNEPISPISPRISHHSRSQSETQKTPFYEVLTKKLESKPGEKIVLAIIYVLVHIGACPEHRALLIDQSALFKELIKLFAMQVDQIRVGLSWLAINITWKENGSANVDFTRRVQKLREYEYVDKLEWLQNGGNGELDDDSRGGSSSSRGLGEISSVRTSDGDMIRGAGALPVSMSLDLRERCRQALAQINDQ